MKRRSVMPATVPPAAPPMVRRGPNRRPNPSAPAPCISSLSARGRGMGGLEFQYRTDRPEPPDMTRPAVLLLLGLALALPAAAADADRTIRIGGDDNISQPVDGPLLAVGGNVTVTAPVAGKA